MHQSLRLERPQLLTDIVVERIREAIVSGVLKLGEQVSEARLAQSIGTSKTPVREALLRLKVERLVEIHPQRGTFVFKLTPGQVGQMCHFRAMVETHALKEAVEHDHAALVQGLQLCLGQMQTAEEANDISALSRIDMDFHRQFLQYCPNEYLKDSYNLIRFQLIALRFRAPIENAIDSHRVLVDAIAQKNIELACDLLQTHVLENEERYCRANEIA